MVQGQAVLTGKNPQCQIVCVNVLKVQEVGKIKASLKREEERMGTFWLLAHFCVLLIYQIIFYMCYCIYRQNNSLSKN